MKKRIIIVLLALFGASFAVNARGQSVDDGWVYGVVDGDTIKVLATGQRSVKCRLFGIDAPEKAQAFGEASKQSLSELVFDKAITFHVVDQDHRGRSICRILLKGHDVSLEQVRRGMAWMYRRYNKELAYSQAEAQAQVSRKGLWADPNPIPPWDFRRQKDGA